MFPVQTCRQVHPLLSTRQIASNGRCAPPLELRRKSCRQAARFRETTNWAGRVRVLSNLDQPVELKKKRPLSRQADRLKSE